VSAAEPSSRRERERERENRSEREREKERERERERERRAQASRPAGPAGRAEGRQSAAHRTSQTQPISCHFRSLLSLKIGQILGKHAFLSETAPHVT